MTMDNLEKCFKAAQEKNANYVAVSIMMPGFEKPEIIINDKENINSKLEYYKKAYNNDLTLKTFNQIKIIGFTYSDTFSDIEADLFE